MKFTTLLLASALTLVAASPVEQRDQKFTTKTSTFTGEAVYNTIVTEASPPYWSTATSIYLWTQTETLAVRATAI
ncbi:hypothetical protein BDQ17DRAFT_1424841 [Cyathus striatus]|nr:hypothetical protein BDQ17DRAFT_1438406 [Cyathus striatus]KAF9003868.1 hypothetical protein BDQ17DRAFT_1424841 [Cyathus striatus]